MKNLIKNFNDFVNEAQVPSHDLLRAGQAGMDIDSTIDWSNDADNAFDKSQQHMRDMANRMKDLETNDPEEYDRFNRLADRTKNWRNKHNRAMRAPMNYLINAASVFSSASAGPERAAETRELMDQIGSNRNPSDIESIVIDFYGLDPEDRVTAQKLANLRSILEN